jgi:hypothetical protein
MVFKTEFFTCQSNTSLEKNTMIFFNTMILAQNFKNEDFYRAVYYLKKVVWIDLMT